MACQRPEYAGARGGCQPPAAHAAVGLAEAFDAPLVATIHATEAGRHSGWVSGPVNRQVHSTEWWLANEADAVITCSRSMSDEVNRLFGPGIAQLHTIANGIVAAARETHLSVPLVVRMKGTNEDIGRKILADSGLPIIAAANMADAAQKIVAAVKPA